MAKDISQVAAALFEKIRSRFDNVSVGDEGAKATQNPEKARFFNFDYVDNRGNNFGNITISLIDENSLKIYFGKNLSADLDEEQKTEWYDFLRDLRMFAKRNILNFDTRDISRSNLNIKDLKQISTAEAPAGINDVNESVSRINKGDYLVWKGRYVGTATGKIDNGRVFFNPDEKEFPNDKGRVLTLPIDQVSVSNPLGHRVAESKLFGTTKTSYENIAPHCRLVIRHDGQINADIHGARSRRIRSIYIEDDQGQRLKCPTNSLTGARAYARHIATGGQLTDDFAQHITELVDECASLRKFVRNTQRKTFEDADAVSMIEAAKQRYGYVHSILGKLKGPRGYKFYKDSWKPAQTLQDDIDLEELRSKFVQQNFDERLEDGLPYAYRAHKAKPPVEQQLDEFEDWAQKVTEGTWALPDNDMAMKKLQDLMSSKLEAGIDGQNATGALYDLIGDDGLFDAIYDASRGSPEVDVRPIVTNWLQANMPSAAQKIEDNLKFSGKEKEETPPPPPAPMTPPPPAPETPPAPAAEPGFGGGGFGGGMGGGGMPMPTGGEVLPPGEEGEFDAEGNLISGAGMPGEMPPEGAEGPGGMPPIPAPREAPGGEEAAPPSPGEGEAAPPPEAQQEPPGTESGNALAVLRRLAGIRR